MTGLTTIAALPRTGGAGMALRSETNTWTKSLVSRSAGWHYCLSILWMEMERERERALELYCGPCQ